MDVAERLATLPIAGLPLLRPVVVHWSAQHVPFIGEQGFIAHMPARAHMRYEMHQRREKFGKPTSGLPVNSPGPPHQKFGNLLKERSRLEKEIEVYESDLLKALQAEAPYSAAVATAKGCLFRFYPTDHEQECQARAGSTEAILVAHDAYLEARHAWWPFGKPVQELQRALKQTRRELRIVNTEIGI